MLSFGDVMDASLVRTISRGGLTLVKLAPTAHFEWRVFCHAEAVLFDIENDPTEHHDLAAANPGP